MKNRIVPLLPTGLLLLASLLSACSQQQLIQKNASYIRGGYAEEVMMQMGEDTVNQCSIDLSNIQTSLISRSYDAKLVDGRLVSGKVVERWNVHNCEKQNIQYIVTVKGNNSGMDDVSVMRQPVHLAAND
ncbi:MAG: hypothetical protein ACAH07_04490 [Methylophilaceae bacterium]|jgi:hypothetical protein|nr:hypothetical protein [Methyloradius sp.]